MGKQVQCLHQIIHFDTSISNYLKKTSFEILQTKQLHRKSENTFLIWFTF
jgi:hypothetical protein